MSSSLYKKTAILGATGHIAKSLIDGFHRLGYYELFLFARSLDYLSGFLTGIKCDNASCKPFEGFAGEEYNVIINCVGIGDPGKLKNAGALIFRLTEAYDNLVLDYLKTHPDTLYINISSGAVYGTDFEQPAENATCTRLGVNHITSQDYYGIAKLNSEAKHRALADLNIIDLRVFGFFSRFIDPKAQYLINEVIDCVRGGKELVTGPSNIVRDYVHPQDFLSLVNKCITEHTINDVFDVYSLKPVTKFEMLEYFSAEYGLKYIVDNNMRASTATGTKDHYYSNNKSAQRIGYMPRFTSLDSIAQESQVVLATDR